MNEELIKKRKLLKGIFNNDITDPLIRTVIFGENIDTEEDLGRILKDTKMYPAYFKNILFLAFYYVYSCYRYDLENDNSVASNVKNHVALRIKKYLDETLSSNSVTMELVEFVLVDIQNELCLGEKSDLKPMLEKLGDFGRGFNFSPMLKAIAEYDRFHGRSETGRLEMTTLMLDIIENLTFLRDYCLVEDSEYQFRFISKQCIKYRSYDDSYEPAPYEELLLEHMFFRRGRRFYRLYSIEKGESKKQFVVRLRYLALKDDYPLLFTLPQDENEPEHHLSGCDPQELYEYIVSNELNPHQPVRTTDQDVMSIGQIHTINYKYLRHLALAISDTISVYASGRVALYNRFAKKYPYIFESRNTDSNFEQSESYNYLDWDSIVIMLLIEVSPTVVLETVIRTDVDDNKPLFCALGRDLYKRVYEVEGLSLFCQKPEKVVEAVRAIIKSKLVLGEAGGFGKLPTERVYVKSFPRAAAMLLLSRLNDCQENNKEDGLSYTGNLGHNIRFLKKEMKEDIDPDKLVRYACIILGETLKHIMSFYAGLIAYGSIKGEFDAKSRYVSMSEKTINAAQKSMCKAFLEAAREMAVKLPAEVATEPGAIMELLSRFVTYCEKSSQANDANVSKSLCAAVGRFEIMDTSRLERLIQMLPSLDARITRDDANVWTRTTLEILEFFRSGSTSDMHMDSDVFNVVYPLTATFNKGRENPDGYKTITFSLNIDFDEDDKADEINVLSEFKYDPNEVYYCLPNITRSNFKWWIDPVLISFRDFNRIFEEIMEDNA